MRRPDRLDYFFSVFWGVLLVSAFGPLADAVSRGRGWRALAGLLVIVWCGANSYVCFANARGERSP